MFRNNVIALTVMLLASMSAHASLNQKGFLGDLGNSADAGLVQLGEAAAPVVQNIRDSSVYASLTNFASLSFYSLKSNAGEVTRSLPKLVAGLATLWAGYNLLHAVLKRFERTQSWAAKMPQFLLFFKSKKNTVSASDNKSDK